MLADHFISLIFFDLTGDRDAVANSFKQFKLMKDGIFDTYGAKANIPDSFYTTLIDLFHKNWVDLRDEYKEIIEQNDQWLQVQIINYMSSEIEKA